MEKEVNQCKSEFKINLSEIPSDEIIKNTEIVIADGELLESVQRMVAKEYSLFMKPGERDEDVAYNDLCIEGVNDDGITFVSLYKDPVDPQKNQILGTLRLVFGNEDREPPLEAMDLIDVIDKKTGKSSWPHENLGGDVDINKVCEVGRFFSSAAVRENQELQFYATSLLLSNIYTYAIEKESKLMISIMPSFVYNFALRNGTNLEELNSTREVVFCNSYNAMRIRERYPIYWYKLDPKLYVVDLFSYKE